MQGIGTKVTQANDIFLFNEVTLDDNRTYYHDVDSDGNVEKIERGENGDIFVQAHKVSDPL